MIQELKMVVKVAGKAMEAGSKAKEVGDKIADANGIQSTPERNAIPGEIKGLTKELKKMMESQLAILPDEVCSNAMIDNLPDEIRSSDDLEKNEMPAEDDEVSGKDGSLEESKENGEVNKSDCEEFCNSDFRGVTENNEDQRIENNAGTNIETQFPEIEKIDKLIGTAEGIKNLIDRHPEKAELWESQLESLEVLNDPESTPTEIKSAQAKLGNLKGQLLEEAVKDAASDAGFDVESHQRVTEGESGGTRPDVIAKNNLDYPITIFGQCIQPEKTISIECKCGCMGYIRNQLNTHIPNQLSGQEGTKVLLTTSDVPEELGRSVCERYGANLVKLTTGVGKVDSAIKEVAEK